MDNAIHAQAGLSHLVGYLNDGYDYQFDQCAFELSYCTSKELLQNIASVDVNFLRGHDYLLNLARILEVMSPEDKLEFYEIKAIIKVIVKDYSRKNK